MTTSYHALNTSAVVFDLPEQVRLDVTGPDRARYLHNLTTNDVKRLKPGQGREAFVTSLQGKTLALVTLLADDDRIRILSDREAMPTLLPHLQKYGVFDDVAIDDATDPTFALHLAGPKAEEVLRRSARSSPGRTTWPTSCPRSAPLPSRSSANRPPDARG